MPESDRTTARWRLTGGLMYAAGGFSLAAHFATDEAGFAAAAAACFAAGLWFFMSAKRRTER